MAFSIRPVDGAFYTLFAESAQHLVKGSALLAEMFAEGTDRAAKAKEMREAESRPTSRPTRSSSGSTRPS